MTSCTGKISGDSLAPQEYHNPYRPISNRRSISVQHARFSGQLRYFGGHSLMNLSHGQSLMSYFRSRYRIRGLYFLDEPETALSPKSQLELLAVLTEMSRAGHAQFIIASHSPMLLACPGADIYSFDSAPVSRIRYEDTEHYRVYREFMENRERYLQQSKAQTPKPKGKAQRHKGKKTIKCPKPKVKEKAQNPLLDTIQGNLS